MRVIEIKDLVKSYNGGEVHVKAAVNGISIDFEEGEFTAVVGNRVPEKNYFFEYAWRIAL